MENKEALLVIAKGCAVYDSGMSTIDELYMIHLYLNITTKYGFKAWYIIV